MSKQEIQALIDKWSLWGDHPDYPSDDWLYEVANGDTRVGYWEWVVSKLENSRESDNT